MKEMKMYIPLKGETEKKFKDLRAPKRPPSLGLLLLCEYGPQSTESIAAWPLVTLPGGWERGAVALPQGQAAC